MTDDKTRDITEQKKAVDELQKKTDDLYRQAEYLKEHQKLFDYAEKIAHFGSLEWYVKTGNMVWSNELYHILGFEPGSFKPTYQMFVDKIHPYDVKRVLESIQKTFDENVPYNTEFRIVRSDNTIRYVQMMGEVYRDEHRQPLKMNGSVQDITGRRQMEEKLKEQNEELLKFTAALDGMDDIVIITDHTGVINYVNHAAERMLGYPHTEVKGKRISEFKSPESRFAIEKEAFLTDPKGAWTGNLILKNKHGLKISTSLKGTAIMKENQMIGRAFVLRQQM